MNHLRILLSLFLLTFLISCDPGSTIEYEISNKTTQPIKVKYQFVSNTSGDTSSQETIINSESSKIINQEAALGYVTQYDERHDSMPFYWLTIEQKNKLTHQNFKDKKYWKLEEKNNQDGTYKLIFDITLFDKK